MSAAADRLARSRLAILQQLERRDRRAGRGDDRPPREPRGAAPDDEDADESGEGMAGWLGSAQRMLRTWWRHHPAHMGLELATPMLSSFARRKPAQFLGIAAVVGAVVVVARPWRLISATGLLVAVLKSSQISNLVMSAMAGADFGKDRPPYE